MYLRKLVLLSTFLALTGSVSLTKAQTADPKDELLQKLNSQFVLTRMTADGTDVVKAGSAVTLHKDGLQMCSVAAKIAIPNSYKDGRLSAGKFAWGMAMGLAQPICPRPMLRPAILSPMKSSGSVRSQLKRTRLYSRSIAMYTGATGTTQTWHFLSIRNPTYRSMTC